MTDRLEHTVRSRGSALLAFGHQLTHSPAEAQDLLQEAITRILSRQSRSSIPIDDPEAYIRTVMVRTMIELRRDPARFVEHNTSPWDPLANYSDYTQAFDATLVDRDQLWEAIGHLPVRQRIVLVLRYYQGATDTQIAHDLGCPSGTVRSLASRALAILRGRLSHSSAD